MTKREIERVVRIIRENFGEPIYTTKFAQYLAEGTWADIAVCESSGILSTRRFRRFRDSIALSILCSELGKVP